MVFEVSIDTFTNVCYNLPEYSNILEAVNKYNARYLKIDSRSIIEIPNGSTHFPTLSYQLLIKLQFKEAAKRKILHKTTGHELSCALASFSADVKNDPSLETINYEDWRYLTHYAKFDTIYYWENLDSAIESFGFFNGKENKGFFSGAIPMAFFSYLQPIEKETEKKIGFKINAKICESVFKRHEYDSSDAKLLTYLINFIKRNNIKELTIICHNARADNNEVFNYSLTNNIIASLQRYQITEKQDIDYILGDEFNTLLKEYSELVKANKAPNLSSLTWKNLMSIAESSKDIITFWANLDKDADLFDMYFYNDNVKNKYFHDCIPTELFNLLMTNSVPRKNKIKEKENNKIMSTENTQNKSKITMPTIKFDFGPVDSDSIALSPYGMAILNSDGSAVTYDPKSNQTIDVTGFTFSVKNMIYKMPTAINQINPGDMIMHKGKPMYVTNVDGTNINAVDILASEAKTVIPVTNMFGFNFVTKVTSFINFGNTTPSPDQPFGNLMPMIMFSTLFGEDNGDNLDLGRMIMWTSLLNGNNNLFGSLFNFGTSN